MRQPVPAIPGVVRGRMIELAVSSGLKDGQAVEVTLQPILTGAGVFEAGEGLRRAFGAWADDGEELDQFIEQLRERRQNCRRPV